MAKTIKQIKALLAETVAIQSESARRQAQAEAERAKAEAEINQLRRENEERRAKNEADIKQIWAYLKSVGQQLANIGLNNGDFAEELFFRALQEYPILGGIIYDLVERNIKDRLGLTEYDILLHNCTASAIIEVKYKAHINDIEKLLQNKPQAFRKSFSQYSHHELHLGLATTVTYDDLIVAAKKAGIYLITQKGSHIEVVNEQVKSF